MPKVGFVICLSAAGGFSSIAGAIRTHWFRQKRRPIEFHFTIFDSRTHCGKPGRSNQQVHTPLAPTIELAWRCVSEDRRRWQRRKWRPTLVAHGGTWLRAQVPATHQNGLARPRCWRKCEHPFWYCCAWSAPTTTPCDKTHTRCCKGTCVNVYGRSCTKAMLEVNVLCTVHVECVHTLSVWMFLSVQRSSFNMIV